MKKILTRPSAFLIVILLMLIALLFNFAIGAVTISPAIILKILLNYSSWFQFDETWPGHFAVILMDVRLPHAVLILITGMALASSGAAYQGLFRNPLADPYLIGVASGAGLGAVAAYSIEWPTELRSFYLIPVAAFVGAFLTILVVYALARVGKTVPLTTLILAGVAVGAFTSAVTSFLMLRSNEQVIRAVSFMLGGSPMSGWKPVLAALPYLIPGIIVLALSGHALNLLQFGEEQAQQMGLNVDRAKQIVIVMASLTTAVAVAFSGVIGFIGLIVPHLVRMIWGPDYRRLIPLSAFGGGAALLLADLLARWVLAPQVLPVGIVTALAGAPFFLWILRRAKQEVFW